MKIDKLLLPKKIKTVEFIEIVPVFSYPALPKDSKSSLFSIMMHVTVDLNIKETIVTIIEV
jgi:hypothetical protein